MEGADGNLSHVELAALADGSLPRAERAHVEAALERSSDLRALLDEQRAAVAAVRALDVPAPAALRARLEAAGSAPERPRGRRLRLGGALALAAVLAVALLPAGQPGAPSVLAAAALAKNGADAAAPAGDATRPNLLDAEVAAVPFPDYGKLGWHATGMRSDALGGRATVTVFYERGGRQVAYTIVSGEALEWPAEARRRLSDGVTFRVVEHARQTIVAWLRKGHTCVLASDDVARRELLELASWKGDGAVPF